MSDQKVALDRYQQGAANVQKEEAQKSSCIIYKIQQKKNQISSTLSTILQLYNIFKQ